MHRSPVFISTDSTLTAGLLSALQPKWATVTWFTLGARGRVSAPSAETLAKYRQLFYHFGVNHVWRVIKRGRVVFAA